jgi:glycosyltransferase involved in cell wall biosynthesis
MMLKSLNRSMSSMSLELPVLSEPIIAAVAVQRRGRPLRICMLAYAFYESDTRILQYATALAERGDTVDVIALRKDYSMPECEILHGVTVHRIQARTVNERGAFAYATRILRFLVHSSVFLYKSERKQAYDIIHVHNAPDFLVFAALWSRWKGTPIILDIHDLLPEFFASKFKVSHDSVVFRLVSFLERCSARFSTHVIIANDLWRDRLVSRSCVQEKCMVVRNRPDLSIFQRLNDKEPSENSKFLLTYPGSLNWHQGVDVAIRAFASIADQIPHAEFHVYGEGAAKASLIDLTRELGMQERILFHGYLPSHEIAKVMARTDLAIEPKRSASAFGNEALSTKIMEFMSLGVPVIASRTRVHAYYYSDAIVQYYDDDDETQLAKQILRLIADPLLRSEFVANALEYVEQNTWDARKHEYTQLIDALAS